MPAATQNREDDVEEAGISVFWGGSWVGKISEKVLGTLGGSRDQTVLQVTYLGKEKVKLRVA